MPHYQHLAEVEGYKIFSLMKVGLSKIDIAQQLHRHPFTINFTNITTI
jgi:IS30 family transposase